MQVVNMYNAPVSVKLQEENGNINYVYVQPRGRVTLPPAVTIERNWLVQHPQIKILN